MSFPDPEKSNPEVNVGDFLMSLMRSKLMDKVEVVVLYNNLDKTIRSEPGLIAEYLIKSGKITRFQADRILKGKSRGLVMKDYQVLSVLGRGGMSTVYLARKNTDLQNFVSMKVLRNLKTERQDRLIARFKREFHIAQKLNHDNVIKVFSLEEFAGLHYMLIEFIQGKSLQKIIDETGPISQELAIKLMRHTLMAMAHCHEHGVIHRDIKPSNIMVTPENQAKLFDFGLAFVEGEKDEDLRIIGGKGYIVGTMDYIAPEQSYNSIEIDGRADLYGLGCTFYHALTGKLPFPGLEKKEKIKAQRSKEKSEPITNFRTDLSDWFVELVERMMNKSKDKRPDSAMTVLLELDLMTPPPLPDWVDSED
ncbi:serine/threonine protein kinase [bacterium]|jgi:serine/threonine protein kinase|nr:serine/threonine protein kinase [bacterium]